MYAIRSYYAGREFFSFAIALQNLLFGLFQPLVGMAADKLGSKRIILVGAIVYAAGLYLVITSYSIHYTKLYEYFASQIRIDN